MTQAERERIDALTEKMEYLIPRLEDALLRMGAAVSTVLRLCEVLSSGNATEKESNDAE